jgi:hypothetical protein
MILFFYDIPEEGISGFSAGTSRFIYFAFDPDLAMRVFLLLLAWYQPHLSIPVLIKQTYQTDQASGNRKTIFADRSSERLCSTSERLQDFNTIFLLHTCQSWLQFSKSQMTMSLEASLL